MERILMDMGDLSCLHGGGITGAVSKTGDLGGEEGIQTKND